MIQIFKCCACLKAYDWYEGIYENPKYDSDAACRARLKEGEYEEESGVFIRSNGIQLKFAEPTISSEESEFSDADGNLAGCFINLCPECLRKLMDNIHPYDVHGNAWDQV